MTVYTVLFLYEGRPHCDMIIYHKYLHSLSLLTEREYKGTFGHHKAPFLKDKDDLKRLVKNLRKELKEKGADLAGITMPIKKVEII